jgi:hypothetical protein
MFSVLVPLYKGKGDVRHCRAFRGVELLEHWLRVLERVFERRFRTVVDIDEMQCGFMQGYGGCIVHSEDVAGEVSEEEEEVVHVF